MAVIAERPESNWLAGGGEMETLVRSMDWSRTPLGPIESWPQSLRTSVNLCLASRFPIVIYWGSDLVTIYNDAYVPILGRKHPRALGQPCRHVWAEIWDVIDPMLAGVVETGEATWSNDLLLMLERRGYPEECYFSFSFTPVRAEDGHVGGVFTAVIETTERVVGARRLLTLRELGQQVTEASTAEHACEHAARTLARNPADLPFSLIYLLDAEGRYAHLAGASGVVVTPELDVMALETAAGGVESWLSRAATGGHAEYVDLEGRFKGLLEGDSPDAVSALVLPLTRAGQTRAYGVLIAGISSRRALDEQYRGFYDLLADGVTTAVANARAYEEERARAQALAAIDRAKTEFFGNVSHEFRTPLTLMLGPIEDLLNQIPATGHTREVLDTVHRNGLRLLRLVNTLLDFSRIEAGRVEAVYDPTDLAALTADLASVFRSAIERGGLRFVVDCAPLPEPVYVDAEMWEKIVLNLLSNAFKFTLQGEIAIGLHVCSERVELRVRDTGVGIPASEVPHVFERFHRLREPRARTHEGTGIGLALVQELVKLHRGTIRAESVEGRGTTMTVSIPRGCAHLPADRIGTDRKLASTANAAGAYIEEALQWLPPGAAINAYEAADDPLDRDAATGAGHGPRPRIVCVDDNADMRAYVSRLLSSRYDVETAIDGRAALDTVSRRPPDLVVSDVMMPHLDGFGLLRALRADPATRLVPVILLSARAGEESRVDGLGAGADDYLVKPFSARELLARVGAHLEISRVRREVLRKETAALAAIEASEAQRRRISRELHDELGQELTALVLGLKSVTDGMDSDSPLRSRVQRLQAIAVQIGRDMHRLVLELRPGSLDEQGLEVALSNYVEDWSKRFDIGADFQSVGFGAHRLPAHLETTIYRIVQESLTNVSRHARATAVSVVVQCDDHEVVAIVEDNGCGFDGARPANAARPDRAIGLIGMKERAALVGGHCHVESRAGNTTVFARLPLASGQGHSGA
jgi:signal transduction histidine kinase